MKNYLRLFILFFGLVFSNLSFAYLTNYSVCESSRPNTNSYGSYMAVSTTVEYPTYYYCDWYASICFNGSKFVSCNVHLPSSVSKKTCSATEYLNTTTNTCATNPTCVGAQTLNATTHQCVEPVCNSTTQYLDTSTHQCATNPTCVGDQTLNATTHLCENPICDSVTQYLDTNLYSCEPNPACVGGQTVNYDAHPRVCQTPQCLDDEYLTSDFYCAKISSKCTASRPYDPVLKICKKLVCEGGLQIENGQCVPPIYCPVGMTYIAGAKRCGYLFPELTQYDYIDGVSYKLINYSNGSLRYRFSIPALPGESLAQTTSIGSPVPSGKMGVKTHLHDTDLWYAAIATVPAFGKKLEFRVEGRISQQSIAEKLTYLTILANSKDTLTVSLDSTNPYSLDVLYSLGYGVDKLLGVFVTDAIARSAFSIAIGEAYKVAQRLCAENPKSCFVFKEFLPDALECVVSEISGASCFGKDETPPPEEELPCTNDDVISICPGTQAKFTSMEKYAGMGYHESSSGFAGACDGSSNLYFGIAKYDAQGREWSRVCIGPLACDSIPNPNKCQSTPPTPNDPAGSDGKKPVPPGDIGNGVAEGIKGNPPTPEEVAGMSGGGEGGGKPFQPGKPGDTVSLKKPTDPVEISSPSDGFVEPLQDKIPLDDKTIFLPNGTSVQTKESAQSKCEGSICDVIPIKQTTTTSPGGVVTTDTQKPDMPPVDPLQFDAPPVDGGGVIPTTSGGTSAPALTQCDKYPDTLGCMKPGEPSEPDQIQTKNIPLDITPPPSSVGSCPPPIQIGVLFGKHLEFSFKYFCDYARGIRPVFLAAGWLTAAFIVFM